MEKSLEDGSKATTTSSLASLVHMELVCTCRFRTIEVAMKLFFSQYLLILCSI